LGLLWRGIRIGGGAARDQPRKRRHHRPNTESPSAHCGLLVR
jgi:hypothetical protein